MPRFLKYIQRLFIVWQLMPLCTNYVHASEKPEEAPEVFFNRVFDKNIHSIMLHGDSWELSPPVLTLATQQLLELRFDDLSDSERSFGYTLIHCDARWKKSEIESIEALLGFGQGSIREHYNSFNTTYSYVHFRLLLPEEECRPILSGNYALVVFEEGYPAKIMFTRRLYISENLVNVNARLKQPLQHSHQDDMQQLDFTIRFAQENIPNVHEDIAVMIQQNTRGNDIHDAGQPTFVRSGELEYKDKPEARFFGGNEFRNFDTKSLKYQAEHIGRIAYQAPYYHIYLQTDEDRSARPYFTKPDLNGLWVVNRERSTGKHIEADYVFVHFQLDATSLDTLQEVHVAGEFNNWCAKPENKMSYLQPDNRYELTVLLKQGFYDYCYIQSGADKQLANAVALEGSFYETQNEYYIYVYLHDRHKGYDRLIGWVPVR